MDQLSKEQEIVRADDAKRLLNDALFSATLDRLERDIMEAWATTSITDKEGVAELSRIIKTTRKFRQVLKVYVEGGRYASDQLRESRDDEPTMLDRFKRRFA